MTTSADCSSAARTASSTEPSTRCVVDQRLDALLLERLAHGVLAVHGPVAAADAGPHALEHLGGVSLGVGAHGRLGRFQHRSALAVATSRSMRPAQRSFTYGCRRSTTSAYSGSGDATSSRSKGRCLSRTSMASETWWKWCLASSSTERW